MSRRSWWGSSRLGCPRRWRSPPWHPRTAPRPLQRGGEGSPRNTITAGLCRSLWCNCCCNVRSDVTRLSISTEPKHCPMQWNMSTSGRIMRNPNERSRSSATSWLGFSSDIHRQLWNLIYCRQAFPNHFQSIQCSVPQVDSNQGVETSQGWSRMFPWGTWPRFWMA